MKNNSYEKSSSNLTIAIVAGVVFVGIALYATQGGTSPSDSSASVVSSGESVKQIARDFLLY